MHDIEMQEMSSAFMACWQASGNHLNKQVQGGIQSWLRAHPYPPFLEHFSFRLGNQLFFIRIEDVDGKVLGPGSMRGLQVIAKANGGHACLLLMKRRMLGGAWAPDRSGWSLIDAETRKPIDPVSYVTDQKIAMTAWEVHDMAVQVVREHIENRGFQIMSWQGNPDVDPAIWFVGKSGEPEWVVVRAALFPENKAAEPENWDAIAAQCARLGRKGHFASVALVSAEQPFASEREPAVPLWRGHALHIAFSGLEGNPRPQRDMFGEGI